MMPPRHIQCHREHAGSARRSLAGSGAFKMPSGGQNWQGSSSTSSSTDDGATADDESSPAPPSPSECFNFSAYSDQDPNLDADEAGGDSNVEGEEINEHSEAALDRLRHDADEAACILSSAKVPLMAFPHVRLCHSRLFETSWLNSSASTIQGKDSSKVMTSSGLARRYQDRCVLEQEVSGSGRL